MTRLLTVILTCIVCMSAQAQRITANFQKTSMSDALLIVERQCKDVHINFIYDELQDFTITQKINNRTVADALRLIAGFYPIRITQHDKVFSVECVQKETSKISGCIVDENSKPLAYASIELLNQKDSAFVNNGVSNNNGDVVIPCCRKDVLAKISFIGYKTIYRHCTNGAFGTVKMEPNVIALERVRVKGERPIVKAEKGILAQVKSSVAI